MAAEKGKVTMKAATEEGRVKNLEAVITQIEKVHGKGSIMKLTDSFIKSVECIPTGCLTLDMALGVGGVPRGRIIEIFGPESSGKTTVTLHIIAEAQRLGGTAAFIDAEHALDPAYAKALGVDIAELYVSQPDNGEQALDICEYLVRSGALDIIVIDSVAALTPKSEIEGEMGQNHVGQQARLMSQALRKLTAIVSKTKTCVIFINQLREKIGVMFGNPETTPGGKALKFYSSVRIDIRKGEAIKDGDSVVGNKTKAKVVKNKVAPPFRSAEFEILYGKGVSNEGCIIELGIKHDIIVKTGSWLSYNDEKIGQGKNAAREFLIANSRTAKEIEEKIRAAAAKAATPSEAGDDSVFEAQEEAADN